MHNRITALALLAALATSAAQAQLRDDAELDSARDAAADAQEAQDAAEVDADSAAKETEIVVDGDEKGEPVDLDSTAIEAAVRASLDASTPVAEGQIDVEAQDDGTVTLAGTVESAAQKELVETVAANTPAVRELRSQLVIRESGPLPPDTER